MRLTSASVSKASAVLCIGLSTMTSCTPTPEMVRFSPDMEPLVRLLEDTPRERVLEEVAARIQRGLSYREVVAALLLLLRS